MSLVIDSQSFPCIYYIKRLTEYKHIKIEEYENFQKMSFMNRYIISGANGIQNLTIPIAGGREQKKLIKDVKIDNSKNWQTKHWRSLLSAYSKAPYFDFYSQDIKGLIFSEEEYLFSFNMNILEWICKILKIDAVIEFTETFVLHYEDETDSRNYFLPKSFQSPENKVLYYLQVFEDRIGFQPNLSIIDLIFCEGPNSRNLMQQSF